jgi:hypothetical protein
MVLDDDNKYLKPIIQYCKDMGLNVEEYVSELLFSSHNKNIYGELPEFIQHEQKIVDEETESKYKKELDEEKKKNEMLSNKIEMLLAGNVNEKNEVEENIPEEHDITEVVKDDGEYRLVEITPKSRIRRLN